MADHSEKREEIRYTTNTPIIFRTFQSFDYFRAKELNHSNDGISFESNFELQPGTVVLVRREKCLENCQRGKACDSCRTTTLATVHWCRERKAPGVTSYSVGAKYFPYGIGY